jgi:flagellar hook-associated protein 2
MASSSSLQVAGLASNFDWKSFTDQIMELEHKPADRLAAEQDANDKKSNALSTLGNKLTSLKVAVEALKSDGLFSRRTASSAATTGAWTTSAGDGTAPGSYKIAVSQLAETARLTGGTDIGSALNPSSDNVAGLTIANLPVGTAVTAGKFTVNGHQVNVALTDSLQDVFNAIGIATGGDVTAGYDHTTDKVTLTSSNGNVVLGAVNDTSNFLRALKLGNNGTTATSSSARLGTVKTSATLANANLGTAVSATGSSSFTINGVSIAYDVTTDTVNSVLKRITDSSAGVTATYDAVTDRASLANSTTGDLGISVSDDAGGLLASLGLMTGSSFIRGKNAEFTINDGPTLSSATNTLDASAHGVTGLSVTVDSQATQTVNVAADSDAMKSKIQTFIDKFNDVQDYLDNQTKITSDGKGKVTTSTLSSNREVQDWSRSLRAMAFGAISGLGSIDRLDDLGIDFTAGTSKLEIKDSTKLTAALASNSADVGAFFHTDTTGFSAKLDTFVQKISTQNDEQQTSLTKANKNLADQIAAIERRLEQQRAVMESAFIQMETAQSKLKSQQSALTNAFSSNSS